MVAVAVAKKAPKPTADNAILYLLGGIVVLSLLKGAALKVFEPVARVAKQAVVVGDELTGGIQGDPGTVTYWTEYDVPFSDTQVPLVNVKEPGQSWMDYVTTVDLPGVPEYNVRDLPGDVKGFFGGLFN
jgi:hypothetical protein